jgi:hypothetical protein
MAVIAELSRPTKQWPLFFVPENRSGLVSPELMGVASHELNHALVALAYGVPIESISVIPTGDSLGRTTIGGLVSLEKLKVIAAGGGVETHDGCAAHGYGNDKYKVDMMHYHHGGRDWESAGSLAASAISKYSTDVRSIASEIIAFLGEVSGDTLPLILMRAQVEANVRKGIDDGPIIKTPTFHKEESQTRTIIDTFPNNIYRITYVVIGKKDEEKYLCGLCLGINDHSKNCPNDKIEKKDSNTKVFSLPELILPIKGEIFSNRKRLERV